MAGRKQGGAVIIDVTLHNPQNRAKYRGEVTAQIIGLLDEVDAMHIKEVTKALKDVAENAAFRWKRRPAKKNPLPARQR